MAILKVRRFAQVTLPASLRKRFHIGEGDYVEAEAVKEGILLKPVAVVTRSKAWKQVFAAMTSVRGPGAEKAKSPQAQEKSIAREIKASRKKRDA
jgi:AbrB family looped-hinge helix DNA binding protein